MPTPHNPTSNPPRCYDPPFHPEQTLLLTPWFKAGLEQKGPESDQKGFPEERNSRRGMKPGILKTDENGKVHKIVGHASVFWPKV